MPGQEISTDSQLIQLRRRSNGLPHNFEARHW